MDSASQIRAALNRSRNNTRLSMLNQTERSRSMLNELEMDRSELLVTIHDMTEQYLSGGDLIEPIGPEAIEIAYLAVELARKSQIDLDMWLVQWYSGETHGRVCNIKSWTLRMMKAVERRMKFKRFIKSL
jgi:hypothetical protein